MPGAVLSGRACPAGGPRPVRITLAAIAALMLFPTSTVQAHKHHRRGCNTNRCDHRVDRAWAKKHPKPKQPMTTVLASWYSPSDSGGTPACGYGWPNNGVAHKTLPCGSRVRMCARACITAIVADRGPYIAGREFDLMPSAKAHLGCGDLCSVRVRILGRKR